MTVLPRVSCIMPTRDRRPFVGQAIRYFLRQDHPDTELVVVDDGLDPVRDLVPDEPRFRYVHTGRRLSVGAKRNLACTMASAAVLAHWDDDDWSAPHRLRRQHQALLDSDAEICGLDDLLYFRPLNGDGWRYRSQQHLAGCSLLYRRELWARNGFPDVDVGEDGALLAGAPPGRRHAVGDRSLMVGVLHGGNTAPKALGARQWHPVGTDEIAALLRDDRAFYALLRNGWRQPTVRERRPEPVTPRMTVEAPLNVHTGYGSMGEYLILSLARAGADVCPVPLGLDLAGLTPELHAMLRTAKPPPRGAPVVFHGPLDGPDPYRHGGDVFLSTMYEADRFPDGWIPRLRRACGVIVPSTFVADLCRTAGVTAPVTVVPQGVDPDVYHWEPRPERDGLTTLIVAPVDQRKHTRLAIAAWQRAFDGDPDARLVIKTTYGYHNYTPDDDRITYVDRIETTRGIAHWYRDADLLMALGSEGFGLPLVEGMATGLPVVALDAEGQADVCRDAGELVLGVPAAGAEICPSSGGRQSVPDAAAVEQRLRWVDTHRAEARALGAAAAEWAATHRNVWSVGPGVLDAIESHPSRRARPRSRPVIWSPSDGTECGVAEYARRLHRALPGATLTRRADRRLGGVVHVQHEPGILDDESLRRMAGTGPGAVAVTAHSVWPHRAPWENRVDALVTTTSAGARALRDRNPGIRVEHIPLGCETWRPPRKRSRGRTVAFFGFPGPHKGLGELAGAVHGLPGCDLILHSAGDPAASLPAMPAGTRWERSWWPLTRITAWLAAEADALVLWYDEVPHFSASSAALIGLAAGVPVLGSPTPWFADLGPAVYRPAELRPGLERLLEDDELRAGLVRAGHDHCERHRWSRIADQHADLWNSLAKP